MTRTLVRTAHTGTPHKGHVGANPVRDFLQTKSLPYGVAAASAIPIKFHVAMLNLGHVLALLILPVILRSVPRSAPLRFISLSFLLALVSGVVLTLLPSPSFDQPALRTVLSEVIFLVVMLLTILTAYWLASNLGLFQAALLLGIARILYELLSPGDWKTNIWKYALGFPSVVALFGAARGRWRHTLFALAVIVGLSIQYGFRSLIFEAGAGVMLAAILIKTSSQEVNFSLWLRRAAAVALVLVASWVGYTNLAANGYLGHDIQARHEKQSRQVGDFLLSARPEREVTAALARARPQGYGFGYVPTGDDVARGQYALTIHQIVGNDGYVSYLLNTKIELHSVAADLWAQTGIGGIILSLALAGTAIAGVIGRRATGGWMALTGFLGVRALWDLGFSPISTNGLDIALCIGLLIGSPAFLLGSRQPSQDVIR